MSGLISGIFNMFGDNEAANADKSAASIMGNAGAAAQSNTQSEVASGQAGLSPYVSGGTGAFNSVAQMMQGAANGQGPLASWTGQFQAPTAAEAAANPGYQFSLQQGMNALQNSAAARGGLLSSGTAQQMQSLGQNMASTNYQQVYNNAMQQYQQQYQQFQNNQSNLYGRLMGLGQTGLSAAGTSAGIGMQGAQLFGQQGLTAAQGQAGYTANAGMASGAGLASLGGGLGSVLGGPLNAGLSALAVASPLSGSVTQAMGF